MGRDGTPRAWRTTVEGAHFGILHSPHPRAGRTFVLVHGIGVSHRYFSRLHRLLARADEVYSLDLPGFGGMPKPGRDLDVPQMARGIAGVLDRLGLRDVVLVGQSMGSQWVVEVGAQRPDLVSHVVVMGPVTDDHHRTALAQSVALALDTLGEPPLANLKVFTDYVRCGPRWYLTQLRHMLAYPIEERAGDLVRPLLVMRGGSDPIAGMQWCRRLRDAATDGALVVVPGSNHLVQYSAPRAVASAIRAFLAGGAAGMLGRSV